MSSKEASKAAILALKRVLCLNYLLYFQKDITDVRVLINLSRQVNAIISAYADKLGLKICSTDVKAKKKDDSTLQTFGIVLASFRIENKLGST